MAAKTSSKLKKPERVLALDIGTRSIVGVVMEKTDQITIRAVELLEHETRSMIDGQIHEASQADPEDKQSHESQRKRNGQNQVHARSLT